MTLNLAKKGRNSLAQVTEKPEVGLGLGRAGGGGQMVVAPVSLPPSCASGFPCVGSTYKYMSIISW